MLAPFPPTRRILETVCLILFVISRDLINLSDLEGLIAGLTLSQAESLRTILDSLTHNVNPKTGTAQESTDDRQAVSPASTHSSMPALDDESIVAPSFSAVSAQNSTPTELSSFKAPSQAVGHRAPSPNITFWKDEATALKEELQRAVAVINGAASVLNPATVDGTASVTSSAEFTAARDYHVPSPSEIGTLYAVTLGKQIGVFCGW
jgi:hypothetical protein